MSDQAILVLRAAILAIGWPVLIVGSIILFFMGWRFAKATKGTIFARLVFPTVLGWLVTMYILGITTTFYMFDAPRKGPLVVFPVFLIWFVTFVVLARITRRWSLEAIKVKNIYTKLEEEVKERTKDLKQAAIHQERQVKEMDKTAKLLVRRDFELLQTNQRLQEIDEAKSHFVSVAAHQLRTPLSAIKWTFHMLLAGDFGKLTRDQRVPVERTAESVERVIALIGDLLSVARIESGQFAYIFEAVAPEMLIDDLVKDANARLYEKNLTLRVWLPDSPLPLARGDREKLLLAFQNVLENAIAYTTLNGIITVTLKKKDERYYQVIVADTGIGIPAHQQSLLFQKFFRGDNVIRQQVAGTGLGLYITKRVIEAHGGTIAVESQEHKGSVFTMTLPFFD